MPCLDFFFSLCYLSFLATALKEAPTQNTSQKPNCQHRVKVPLEQRAELSLAELCPLLPHLHTALGETGHQPLR